MRSRLLFNGHAGICLYRDGWRELRRARPDILHAEVEAWSLAALQCVLARVAPVVLFTWRTSRDRAAAWPAPSSASCCAGWPSSSRGTSRRTPASAKLGVPDQRVAVLPQFGVDPGALRARRGARAARVASDSRGPVVGFVGRLVPEKGVDLLMDALEPLEAQLLVVGDGPARPAAPASGGDLAPGARHLCGCRGPRRGPRLPGRARRARPALAHDVDLGRAVWPRAHRGHGGRGARGGLRPQPPLPRSSARRGFSFPRTTSRRCVRACAPLSVDETLRRDAHRARPSPRRPRVHPRRHRAAQRDIYARVRDHDL